MSATAYLVRVPKDFVITELHKEVIGEESITLENLNRSLQQLFKWGCIDRANGGYCMSPAFYVYLHLPKEMIIKKYHLVEWNDVMINLTDIENHE
jgi:hypothetical protein